jgi:hypothetical protein
MDNGHFDAEETPSSEALPAELRMLYQRLDVDGALWRAQTQTHVDEIERALTLEAGDLANPGGVAGARRNQRSLADIEVTDALPQAPPEHIRGERSMSVRRRTGILSGLAVVVVVALLALTFYSFVGGRASGPPASSTASSNTPTTVDGWETLSKLTQQMGMPGNDIPAIAASNTNVVYQPFRRMDSDGIYELLLRRTDDGGRSWHNLPLPVNPRNLNDLSVLVSPLDAHAVYMKLGDQDTSACTPGNSNLARVNGNILASGSGVCFRQFFSTDGGETWGPAHLSVPGVLIGIGTLTATPPLIGQGSRLYGMSSCLSGPCTRLITSTDGGHNWNVADAQLIQQGQLVCDAAAAATGTTIFAVTSRGDCSRLDQNARALWRSDDSSAHWTRVSTLPTTNEHGIYAVSREIGQQPRLYAVLPKTIGHENDKTGYPQPVISEAPEDLKVSENGGKTWQSAPSSGSPANLVMYYSAIGVLSDGSIVVPFTATNWRILDPMPPFTLYKWQVGAESWTRLTQIPDLGNPQSFLVTPQSPSSTNGKDSLWVIIQGLPPAGSANHPILIVRYRVG